MNVNIFRIFVLILIFFSNSIRAENLRIVYSSSLTGNLFSCICGLKLSVGLAKRGSFFKQIGINPNADILIDTGNSLDIKSSIEKTKAIFESFQTLGYHSVGIGQNDLQENTISILMANNQLTHSANLFQKGFFQTSSFGKPVTYIKRNKNTFGIINLSSPEILYELNNNIKSKLIVQDMETTVSKLTSSETEVPINVWIILLHGTKEEAEKIYSLNPNFIVIYGGKNNIKLSNSGKSAINDKQIYSTADLLGDKIGILTLTDQKSRWKVTSSEVTEMNVDKLTDSEEILKIMKKYNIKPE